MHNTVTVETTDLIVIAQEQNEIGQNACKANWQNGEPIENKRLIANYTT